MWERKHQPRDLGELALTPGNRRTFETWLARREIPGDLMLVGVTGQGKSTVAAILEGALAFHAEVINASGHRGVDVVRGKITELMTAGTAFSRDMNPGGCYRIVRLEEADGMTPDGLRALRTVIDERPAWVRFILTGNRLPSDEAIVGRCRVREFGHLPLDEQVRVVNRILAAERLDADPEIITACAKASPTMRWLIGYVEDCFNELGRLEPPPARQSRTGRERRDTKRQTDLLLALHAIISESGRPRLPTKVILSGLAEVGISFPGKQPSQALANAVKPLVRPKTFTDPGAKSAHGYHLADLERALQKGKHPG